MVAFSNFRDIFFKRHYLSFWGRVKYYLPNLAVTDLRRLFNGK